MTSSARPLEYDNLRTLLAPRERDSHKGRYGHVLVVGGARGFGGAALMAAEAAARCGAGLTSVATHPDHVAAFLARRPELMVHGLHDLNVINVRMDQATVLVIGPGLGSGDWGKEALHTAMQAASKRDLPVLLDADALNLLGEGKLDNLLEHKSKWVLTPHPGEAASLLKLSVEDIQLDRDAAVRSLQQTFGGVAILKGAGTLVCYTNGSRQQVETCMHGNPGMASGGMGDVLSGIIGGLIAQGYSLADSARLGVCLHGKAADMEAEQLGERGMLASDLLPQLRLLLNP